MSDPQPIPGTPQSQPSVPSTQGTHSTPGTPPTLGPVVGYCRSCGKALDAAAVRAARGTIYCADHAPADASGDPAQGGAANASTPPPFPGSPYAGLPYSSPPYGSPYTSPYSTPGVPPPLARQDTSPGLAFLLGLIPGVGAVYNGQYAKGLVHVVIVGLIISILSNGAAEGLEALLGLLLAAFFAYMAFEAYHTARRRQQGQPVDEFSSVLPGHGGRFPAAPVVVITLGVIFLLSNLQILEIRRLLRYWPVLMIGLGVYMLVARLSGQTSGQARSGGAPGGMGNGKSQ